MAESTNNIHPFGMERPVISMIKGKSSSGKSFVSIDLLVSIIGGSKFIGTEHLGGMCGGVVHITCEGIAGIPKRIKCALNQHGLDESVADKNLLCIEKSLDLKEIHPEVFASNIMQFFGYDSPLRAIIIDSYSAYFYKFRSNKMAAVRWMRELSALTGASIFVVCDEDTVRDIEGFDVVISTRKIGDDIDVKIETLSIYDSVMTELVPSYLVLESGYIEKYAAIRPSFRSCTTR